MLETAATMPIHLAPPDLGEAEVEAVAEVIRSGWITTGPQTHAFEKEFAEFVGGGVQAIAVNSATAGLHLAMEAIGVGPGDEVIVPDWTFTATAEGVRHLGAKLVIVDVEKSTLNMDPAALSAAITERTKAVVVVHFAGMPVDLKAIQAVIAGRSIALIEDAAHALPVTGTSGIVGSCRDSDIAVFSFYATKTITTGEGGMICTRSSAIADRCRLMRLHGIDKDAFDRLSSDRPAWHYDVVAPGYKYNLTDIAAALGRVQLRRAESMRLRRQEIASYYMSVLGDLDVGLPPVVPSGIRSSWHLFVLRLSPDGVSRNSFVNAMSKQGVGTSVHFPPLHRLTLWKQYVPAWMVPVAEAEADYVISLPLSSALTDDQVERVAAVAVSALAQ